MPSNSLKPITHRALAKRSRLPATGKAKSATVPLLDISLERVKAPKLIRKDGRLRIVATLDADGKCELHTNDNDFERFPACAGTTRCVHPNRERVSGIGLSS